MGSNLDTLVNIGLEKFPPDYRLAQQVCQAITSISDRRKVSGPIPLQLTRIGENPISPSYVLISSFLSPPPQPSLGKRQPPFRLPQEHRLFKQLQEMVVKGEYSLARARAVLGVRTASNNLSFILARLRPPRPFLDPVQRGGSEPRVPAGRGA